MKLTVMTLGCPDWDLDTILRNVPSYGFAGVDFRGLGAALDITTLPAFTTDLAATARRIKDAGLEVSGISSSLTVCSPEKRAANLEEARRTVPVALGLGAENVRVFGGGPADTLGHEAAAKIGVECMQQVLDIPGARQLSWNFETHDQWVSSKHIKLLLDAISDPAFGALWDMGHPFRVLGETPAATLAALGPRLRYTHVKDAVRAPNHPLALTEKDGQKIWRYVAPGAGELQLAEGIRLLRQAHYDGWLCFEHEKRWIKGLPAPEEIFPQFITWAKKTLA